jgi:outer membrane receptor protein involved in Fe transport
MIMLKKNLLLILVLHLSTWTFGQHLTGKIVDNNAEPLPGATIAAYQQDKLVNGVVSDFDGNFSLPLKPGTYELRVSFVSFQSKTLSATLESSNKSLGTIPLSPAQNELAEVTVEAEANMMTFEQDKRVYNVAADLVNKGLNASDILNNIPSVATDVEGNVSLRGSEAVRILINGKPSGLIGSNPAEALRLLQGSQIERIEVITNPSARYDAEGQAGIINIILKKEQERGFNGNVEARVGYPDNYGTTAGLNYRTSKINFFTNLGINYNRSPGGGSSVQNFFGDTTYSFIRDRSQLRGGTNATLNLGLDYYFNPNTSITTSFLYRPSEGNNLVSLSYDDYSSDALVKQTLREEDEIEKERTLEGDLHFERLLSDDKKHKWTIDLKFQDSDDRENSTIEQTSTDSDDTFTQYVQNQEDEQNILVQSDYVKPFSEKRSIEMGTRSTFRTVINNFSVRQGDSVLENFTNNFNYQENIIAGYFIFNDGYEKWTYQLGLRSEYTDINTALLNRIDEPIKKQYLNFFPSAFFTYKANKVSDIQLSYSRRLSRPNFRSLLPFSNFSDNRNLYRGNPDLDPEFTNSYEAGYVRYWDKITLYSGIYYRHTSGVVERIITVDSTGVSTFLPINLSVQDAYGLEFTYTHKLLDWWNLSGNLNIYQAITVGGFDGIDYSNTNFSAQGRLSSRWDFWGSSLQANGNLRAPSTTAQGTQKGIYTLDLAWSKDLWNKNGTLTFSVNDLFNSRRRRSTTRGANFESVSDFQWRQRQFLLTFTYRINQQKKRPTPPQRGEMGDDGGM